MMSITFVYDGTLLGIGALLDPKGGTVRKDTTSSSERCTVARLRYVSCTGLVIRMGSGSRAFEFGVHYLEVPTCAPDEFAFGFVSDDHAE
jgi:hypothetical protein